MQQTVQFDVKYASRHSIMSTARQELGRSAKIKVKRIHEGENPLRLTITTRIFTIQEGEFIRLMEEQGIQMYLPQEGLPSVP